VAAPVDIVSNVIISQHDVGRWRLAFHDTAVITPLLLFARLKKRKRFLTLLIILNLELIDESIHVLVAM
jgi:hypothetical protein